MSSKHLPHGNVKHIIRRSHRMRGGALKFDFWGLLSKFGNVVQKVIDTAAPLTSKIVGPLTSALTGIPLTGVISAAQNAANNPSTASMPSDVLPLLQQIMNRGVSTNQKPTAGKGVKKKRGKGINIL